MENFKKQSNLSKGNRIPLIVLLCAGIYFVSYLSRLSFTAVTAEIILAEGFSEEIIAIPLTALSITYGIGQLLFGYLGDKLSPEKMIFIGLLIASGMNFSIPFISSSIIAMTIFWAINGFAQAMMWPPIVKILTTCLSPSAYHKNIVYIGWGSSVGTIVIYLFASLSIAVINWRAVFFFASITAFCFAIIWIRLAYKAEEATEGGKQNASIKKEKQAKLPFHNFAIILLLLIVIGIALQGVLRDGISTWMPTYMTKVFKLDTTVSTLSNIALPIFSMFIMWFSAFIYRKYVKNEAACAIIFFCLCAASTGLLYLSSSSAILSIACLTVANAATHGVNMMYTSLVVPNFAPYGKTSFVTGLINSAAYVGSAASIYGMAIISKYFGWNGTIISWLLVSVLGMAFAFFSLPSLKKLKNLNKID